MADLAPRVRWDRVGRVALLLVLLLVGLLYVNPARNYVSTLQESRAKERAIAQLSSDNERLRARRDALRRTGTLEREARKLGMVRPGERAYVLRGLPE
jgi:cell division protein FtsB